MVWFKVACRYVFLRIVPCTTNVQGWQLGRLTQERQTTSLYQSTFRPKSCDQGLRITNAPGANIHSRRLFVEIKNVLLIIPFSNPTVAAQRQAHKRAVFSPSAKGILIAAQTKNKLLSRIKCHITENIFYNSFHLASFFPAPPFSDRVAHGVSISTPQRQHHWRSGC